jgi:hypothetical protein
MSAHLPSQPIVVDRAALAETVAGNRPPPTPEDLPDWLRAAEAEGVAALLAWRCLEAGESALPAAARETLRTAAARELLADAAERRAVRLLRGAGIPFLVLKGAALARWLYPAPYLRPRSDLDLLFPEREVVAEAAAALAPAGYVMADDSPPHPSYEIELRRTAGPFPHTIDAHWQVANSGVHFDCLRFDELAAAARPVPGLDGALGLEPVHALLHACVHRLSNIRDPIGDLLHWLFDIHLLACGLDDSAWSRLVRLALERRLAGPCESAFAAVSALFATPVPAPVRAELTQAASREPFRMERAASFRHYLWNSYLRLGGRERLAFLRRMTFPSFAYMRIQFGLQSRAQLPAAYVRRLLRGLGKYSR